MNKNKFISKIPADAVVSIYSVLGLLLLIIIVSILPVSFSVYRITDSFAPVWFLITLSGGVYGSAIVILGLTIYLFNHFKSSFAKKKKALLFSGLILAVQILISASTLFYIKGIFQNPRPSQLYILEKNSSEKSREGFFAMPLDEKNKYLRKSTEENQKAFEDVYPPILNSWVDESGYSFPSGHSETSFFLGTIMAFVFFKTGRKKIYIILPLIWAVLVAVSRVIIGVHYPSDVIAGAATGMSAALIIVSLKNIKAIFK